MKFTNIFTLALYCAAGRVALGAAYYVATNGLDTQPGTLAQPFKTIQRAANVVVAGDTCYVRGGTYRESVAPLYSGSAASPITYRNYSNEVVTISGAEPVTNWTVYSGNIWLANMASNWFSRATPGDGSRLFDPVVCNESDLVLWDGQMMALARWPNSVTGCTNLLDPTRPPKGNITAYISKTTASSGDKWTTGVVEDSNLPQLGDNGYVGSEVVFQPNSNGWSWAFSGYISASTNRAGGGTRLVMRSPSAYGKENPPATTYAVGSRYWLWNKLQFLDAPGEWFHDKPANKLYFWAPDGASPEGRVEARKRRFAFDLSGKSYITIHGFQLLACSITTDNISGGDNIGYKHTDGVISSAVTNRWPWRDVATKGVATSTGCILENLNVNYPTWFTDVSGDFALQWGKSSGIVLSGTDHVLRHSVIRNSAGNGVTVMGNRIRVQDCLIENVCCLPAGLFGVDIVDSQDCEAGYNTIRYVARSGLRPGGMTNNAATSATNDWKGRIHHNDIHNFGMQDWDVGAIYAGSDLGWIRVDHNWLHSVYPNVDGKPNAGAYISGGVYFDWCKNAVVDHNFVWDVWAGLNFNNVVGGSGGPGVGNILCYNNTSIVIPTASWVANGPFSASDGGATHIGTVISNNILACGSSTSYYKAMGTFSGSSKGKNVSINNGTAGALAVLGLNLQGGANYPAAFFPTASSSQLVDQAVSIPDLVRDGLTIPAYNDSTNGSAPDIGAYEFGQTPWVAGFRNQAPVAAALIVSVAQNAFASLLLSASDGDGDAPVFQTNSLPLHGSLSGFNPLIGTVKYTPTAGYLGSDSFTFSATDGFTNSAPMAVTLNVVTIGRAISVAATSVPVIVTFSNMVSGWSYEVQRATNANFTGGLRSWFTNASASGALSMLDNFNDLPSWPGQAFYRLHYTP